MAAVTAPEFKQRLAASGITPDEPLHEVLVTVFDTATEAREIVGKGARGLSPEGEKALIQRIAETSADATHREIDRMALRIGWKNAILLAISGLVLLGGGYLIGTTAGRTGFLGRLEAQNDVGAIERYCLAHTVQQDGGTACQMPPMWIRR